MNDKQNIYLDKVVEFLVRDTKIDFKGKEIFLPFRLLSDLSPHLHLNPFLPLSSYHLFLSLLSFSKYCKVTYGLTDQEIEYVWKEYKEIIKDKITNK